MSDIPEAERCKYCGGKGTSEVSTGGGYYEDADCGGCNGTGHNPFAVIERLEKELEELAVSYADACIDRGKAFAEKKELQAAVDAVPKYDPDSFTANGDLVEGSISWERDHGDKRSEGKGDD